MCTWGLNLMFNNWQWTARKKFFSCRATVFHFVFTECIVQTSHLFCWFDSFRIDFLELIDVLENGREFFAEFLYLLITQINASELCDMPDFIVCKFSHG